ncbi:gliding motility protein GldL [Dysgonomonas sp. 520]|uniref:type IX secretion system motor protein PorL/GldL n=1 Tax=Dysgonomonas sp. 520 TaxID=2302931 RepID=UPI0013D13EAD|nr:gliding motility protein GldL [Dysgonomonas sp. 520]NDW08399.1 gliding motility protein GldL [Dysgonomonas sp. 520]
MGKKYRRYKNSFEKFMASEKGKRYFNFFYSWGASIVIIGALFKINHWKYGTEILVVGMVVEAIIFFISAFDLPAREYKWDRIFPGLNKKKEGEEPLTEEEREIEAAIAAAGEERTGPAIMHTSKPSSRGGAANAGGGSTTIIVGGSGSGSTGASSGAESTVSEGGSATGGSINLGGPIDPTEAAEVMEASEKYADQLNKMTANMEKFAEVTESLTKVSDTLLNSFKTVTDNPDSIGINTQAYVDQMQNLNRNIAGLNTIYEIQLKGVSGQISTIEQINAGLDRIKNLYAGSLVDSSIFKNETEKMAVQLAELNRVYARMLQAMTTNMNMGMGGGFNNPGNIPPQESNTENK